MKKKSWITAQQRNLKNRKVKHVCFIYFGYALSVLCGLSHTSIIVMVLDNAFAPLSNLALSTRPNTHYYITYTLLLDPVLNMLS